MGAASLTSQPRSNMDVTNTRSEHIAAATSTGLSFFVFAIASPPWDNSAARFLDHGCLIEAPRAECGPARDCRANGGISRHFGSVKVSASTLSRTLNSVTSQDWNGSPSRFTVTLVAFLIPPKSL